MTTDLTTPGQIYRDFKLIRAFEIPEIQVFLRELIHEPTGASVLALEADDPENVFCLSFKTIPLTSNGVAHILEHIVLAGSEKFPVKDPFFSMTRRSLNTFMNAFTGSDFTCYPAASLVEKDFYNLLDVYLDAVFHPKLDRLSFLQEGHRLEFEEADDPKTPLQFKGVVYNEMKGALTSAVSRLHEEVSKALFPDITYGQNSGGDPKFIPDLTHEELKNFHKTFYHPSRCIFYFYGNIPLTKHLDFLLENALKGVKKEEPLEPIAKQKRFDKPKSITASYPAKSKEDLNYIALSWLTCPVNNQEEVLALTILETLLMGTDASFLKKALLKSGLCTSAFTYLETETTEIPLTLILAGCDAKKEKEIEEFVIKTLKDIASEEIPIDLIESAIHQIEFSRTEITEDNHPHGLSLFFRSALLKQQGALPEDGLKIHSLFNQLRKDLNINPRYFQGLIEKYLVDNTHRVKVVMTPDETLAKKEAEEESEKLKNIEKTLTDQDIKRIVEEAEALEELQELEENIDVLPMLSLSDIPLKPVDFPLSIEKSGSIEVYHHDCFTNDIVYADLNFDLPHLNPSQWPLLRLFASLLSQMGCADRSYSKQLEDIQAYTGGVGATLGQYPQADDPDSVVPTISLRGKALYRNSEKLFQLIKEMTTSVNFSDIPRLREIIQTQATGFKSSLTNNAMNYAKQLSASALRQATHFSNGCFGLPYFHYICRLAESFDDRPQALVGQLEEMREKTLLVGKPHLILSCDSKEALRLKKNDYFGLNQIELKPYKPWERIHLIEPISSQGLIIPSPVAFTSHAMRSVPYVHPDSPALAVASQLFEHITLHKRIREQGGAYGSGSGNKSIQGLFMFYGYRDPNIASTLKAFRESIDNILTDDFTDEELNSAKLEILQGIDTPISPGSRAEIAYVWQREGRTFERRMHYRDSVIGLTREHIKSAIDKHLLKNFEKGTTVVLAGKELLESENKKLLKPLVIHEIA